MSWAGRHCLVLGLGRSGLAASRLLCRLGARVTAYDRHPDPAAELPAGVEVVGGDAPPPFDRFDRVVTSPGFPVEPDARVVPEVDLAAELIDAPLIGVTGTNGKSTVAVMIGEMLAQSGKRVAVGGNLGTPLCELADEEVDRVVAELSSFQLEHAQVLRADVAVLLNLAPDHLDRHRTLEAYGAAKARLAENQGSGDALVFNADDEWASRIASRSRARVVAFSARRRLERGAFLDGSDFVVATEGGEILRIPRGSLSLASRSPIYNALAAAAGAATCGAHGSAIERVLRGFGGLPHRGTLVCIRNRVRYVDDSKATNPAAAAASISIQTSPVVWIGGGRNKGLAFDALEPAARAARAAIVLGEAAPELAAALRGIVEVVEVGTLEKAVAEAARRARPGDVVLLAPACTSLDQFRSFEERGEQFARLARALPDAGPSGGGPAPC